MIQDPHPQDSLVEFQVVAAKSDEDVSARRFLRRIRSPISYHIIIPPRDVREKESRDEGSGPSLRTSLCPVASFELRVA